MTVQISLTGADAALGALEAMARGGWLDEPTDAAAAAVIPVAQGYPPPRGGTYQRTYTLRDGWNVVARAIGPVSVLITIGNPVVYAPDVVGDRDQAGIHVGYWPTESEIVTLATDDAERAFLGEFDAWLGGVW